LYISDLDIIKQKLGIEGKLNRSEIIKMILNDASLNEKRLFMDVGERYYEGEQDIIGHNFQLSTVYDEAEDPDNPRHIAAMTSVVPLCC
jgi:hypothetical protein